MEEEIVPEICPIFGADINHEFWIRYVTRLQHAWYRAFPIVSRIRAWRNHGHSCFLCEIVIRSQFHTTYEPEA